MLNTSVIKKNNDNTQKNGIDIKKNIINGNIIEESIKKIEANSNANDIDMNNNDIIKSFHSMENKIFSDIHGVNQPQSNKSTNFKIDNFNLNEITKKFSD